MCSKLCSQNQLPWLNSFWCPFQVEMSGQPKYGNKVGITDYQSVANFFPSHCPTSKNVGITPLHCSVYNPYIFFHYTCKYLIFTIFLQGYYGLYLPCFLLLFDLLCSYFQQCSHASYNKPSIPVVTQSMQGQEIQLKSICCILVLPVTEGGTHRAKGRLESREWEREWETRTGAILKRGL